MPPGGVVATPYIIGKCEVTITRYAEFPNQVAATDANGLYSRNMSDDTTFGGITRSGSSGSYSYAAKSGFSGTSYATPPIPY